MLISFIQSPCQLSSEGRKKAIFVQSYQIYPKSLLFYGQLNRFVYDLSSGIQRTDKHIGSAFNFEGNYAGVGNYN